MQPGNDHGPTTLVGLESSLENPMPGENVKNMKQFAKHEKGRFSSSILSLLRTKCVSLITIKKALVHTLLSVVVIFATGCATNGVDRMRSDGGETQENVEITEDYNVDDEVRTEFESAVALMKSGQYAEAIMPLRAVAAKARRFTSPLINLGIAYSKTDELEKAEESLKKALKLNKLHPVANNELALVYRRSGRFAEARKTYEDLLARYPAFLPARKNLGVLCDIYLQDLNCALQQYEFYLDKLPDDEQVKIWVADVKGRM